MKRLFPLIGLPLIATSLLLALYSILYPEAPTEALRIGSRGDDVLLLQEKLTSLGLFTDDIDGIYDRATSEAVRRFQLYNGLEGSGVCDSETLDRLLPEQDSLSSGQDNTVRDLLALYIDSRCGDASYLAKCACGAVIVNRSKSDVFPGGILGNILSLSPDLAVYEGGFSIRPSLPGQPSPASLNAADFALSGGDPTNGALYMSEKGQPLSERLYRTLTVSGFSFGK